MHFGLYWDTSSFGHTPGTDFEKFGRAPHERVLRTFPRSLQSNDTSSFWGGEQSLVDCPSFAAHHLVGTRSATRHPPLKNLSQKRTVSTYMTWFTTIIANRVGTARNTSLLELFLKHHFPKYVIGVFHLMEALLNTIDWRSSSCPIVRA